MALANASASSPFPTRTGNRNAAGKGGVKRAEQIRFVKERNNAFEIFFGPALSGNAIECHLGELHQRLFQTGGKGCRMNLHRSERQLKYSALSFALPLKRKTFVSFEQEMPLSVNPLDGLPDAVATADNHLLGRFGAFPDGPGHLADDPGREFSLEPGNIDIGGKRGDE